MGAKISAFSNLNIIPAFKHEIYSEELQQVNHQKKGFIPKYKGTVCNKTGKDGVSKLVSMANENFFGTSKTEFRLLRHTTKPQKNIVENLHH
jgi:hypothetical protein